MATFRTFVILILSLLASYQGHKLVKLNAQDDYIKKTIILGEQFNIITNNLGTTTTLKYYIIYENSDSPAMLSFNSIFDNLDVTFDNVTKDVNLIPLNDNKNLFLIKPIVGPSKYEFKLTINQRAGSNLFINFVISAMKFSLDKKTAKYIEPILNLSGISQIYFPKSNDPNIEIYDLSKLSLAIALPQQTATRLQLEFSDNIDIISGSIALYYDGIPKPEIIANVTNKKYMKDIMQNKLISIELIGFTSSSNNSIINISAVSADTDIKSNYSIPTFSLQPNSNSNFYLYLADNPYYFFYKIPATQLKQEISIQFFKRSNTQIFDPKEIKNFNLNLCVTDTKPMNKDINCLASTDPIDFDDSKNIASINGYDKERYLRINFDTITLTGSTIFIRISNPIFTLDINGEPSPKDIAPGIPLVMKVEPKSNDPDITSFFGQNFFFNSMFLFLPSKVSMDVYITYTFVSIFNENMSDGSYESHYKTYPDNNTIFKIELDPKKLIQNKIFYVRFVVNKSDKALETLPISLSYNKDGTGKSDSDYYHVFESTNSFNLSLYIKPFSSAYIYYSPPSLVEDTAFISSTNPLDNFTGINEPTYIIENLSVDETYDIYNTSNNLSNFFDKETYNSKLDSNKIILKMNDIIKIRIENSFGQPAIFNFFFGMVYKTSETVQANHTDYNCFELRNDMREINMAVELKIQRALVYIFIPTKTVTKFILKINDGENISLNNDLMYPIENNSSDNVTIKLTVEIGTTFSPQLFFIQVIPSADSLGYSRQLIQGTGQTVKSGLNCFYFDPLKQSISSIALTNDFPISNITYKVIFNKQDKVNFPNEYFISENEVPFPSHTLIESSRLGSTRFISRNFLFNPLTPGDNNFRVVATLDLNNNTSLKYDLRLNYDFKLSGNINNPFDFKRDNKNPSLLPDVVVLFIKYDLLHPQNADSGNQTKLFLSINYNQMISFYSPNLSIDLAQNLNYNGRTTPEIETQIRVEDSIKTKNFFYPVYIYSFNDTLRLKNSIVVRVYNFAPYEYIPNRNFKINHDKNSLRASPFLSDINADIKKILYSLYIIKFEQYYNVLNRLDDVDCSYNFVKAQGYEPVESKSTSSRGSLDFDLTNDQDQDRTLYCIIAIFRSSNYSIKSYTPEVSNEAFEVDVNKFTRMTSKQDVLSYVISFKFNFSRKSLNSIGVILNENDIDDPESDYLIVAESGEGFPKDYNNLSQVQLNSNDYSKFSSKDSIIVIRINNYSQTRLLQIMLVVSTYTDVKRKVIDPPSFFLNYNSIYKFTLNSELFPISSKFYSNDDEEEEYKNNNNFNIYIYSPENCLQQVTYSFGKSSNTQFPDPNDKKIIIRIDKNNENSAVYLIPNDLDETDCEVEILFTESYKKDSVKIISSQDLENNFINDKSYDLFIAAEGDTDFAYLLAFDLNIHFQSSDQMLQITNYNFDVTGNFTTYSVLDVQDPSEITKNDFEKLQNATSDSFSVAVASGKYLLMKLKAKFSRITNKVVSLAFDMLLNDEIQIGDNIYEKEHIVSSYRKKCFSFNSPFSDSYNDPRNSGLFLDYNRNLIIWASNSQIEVALGGQYLPSIVPNAQNPKLFNYSPETTITYSNNRETFQTYINPALVSTLPYKPYYNYQSDDSQLITLKACFFPTPSEEFTRESRRGIKSNFKFAINDYKNNFIYSSNFMTKKEVFPIVIMKGQNYLFRLYQNNDSLFLPFITNIIDFNASYCKYEQILGNSEFDYHQIFYDIDLINDFNCDEFRNVFGSKDTNQLSIIKLTIQNKQFANANIILLQLSSSNEYQQNLNSYFIFQTPSTVKLIKSDNKAGVKLNFALIYIDPKKDSINISLKKKSTSENPNPIVVVLKLSSDASVSQQIWTDDFESFSIDIPQKSKAYIAVYTTITAEAKKATELNGLGTQIFEKSSNNFVERFYSLSKFDKDYFKLRFKSESFIDGIEYFFVTPNTDVIPEILSSKLVISPTKSQDISVILAQDFSDDTYLVLRVSAAQRFTVSLSKGRQLIYDQTLYKDDFTSKYNEIGFGISNFFSLFLEIPTNPLAINTKYLSLYRSDKLDTFKCYFQDSINKSKLFSSNNNQISTYVQPFDLNTQTLKNNIYCDEAHSVGMSFKTNREEYKKLKIEDKLSFASNYEKGELSLLNLSTPFTLPKDVPKDVVVNIQYYLVIIDSTLKEEINIYYFLHNQSQSEIVKPIDTSKLKLKIDLPEKMLATVFAQENNTGYVAQYDIIPINYIKDDDEGHTNWTKILVISAIVIGGVVVIGIIIAIIVCLCKKRNTDYGGLISSLT